MYVVLPVAEKTWVLISENIWRTLNSPFALMLELQTILKKWFVLNLVNLMSFILQDEQYQFMHSVCVFRPCAWQLFFGGVGKHFVGTLCFLCHI